MATTPGTRRSAPIAATTSSSERPMPAMAGGSGFLRLGILFFAVRLGIGDEFFRLVFLVGVSQSGFEVLDALAQTLADIGDPARAEQEERDQDDHNQLGCSDASQHGILSFFPCRR